MNKHCPRFSCKEPLFKKRPLDDERSFVHFSMTSWATLLKDANKAMES